MSSELPPPLPPETDAGAPAAPPEKPARVPWGPRVFGKWAWTTWFPFLVFYIGTFCATYFDNVREKVYLRDEMPGHEETHFGEFPERNPGLVIYAADRKYLFKSGLNAAEMEAGLREIHRVMRGHLEQGMELDAAKPPVSLLMTRTKETLQVKPSLTDDELRTFLASCRETADAAQVPTDVVSPWTFPAYQSWYPQIYVLSMIATLLAMVCAIPGYRIPAFRISWLSVVVGTLGIVVWIGLYMLDRDYIGLGARFGGLGKREAFKPFDQLIANPSWMYQFLTVRLLGMCLIVPMVEEFFLRGFLIRYLDDPDWDEIPLGVTVTPIGFWGALAYGPMTHPAEAIAAAAWFGMMLWMYFRTKSIWDCVVAHAITNTLLAIYIFKFNAWELW